MPLATQAHQPVQFSQSSEPTISGGVNLSSPKGANRSHSAVFAQRPVPRAKNLHDLHAELTAQHRSFLTAPKPLAFPAGKAPHNHERTKSPTQEVDVVRADVGQAASLDALEDLSKHDAVTSKQSDISQSYSIGRSEHRNELRDDAVSKKVLGMKIPNSFLVHKWMMMEQTTRAASRVSDDQQSILNRPESWNRPEVGSRFPPANIPVAILQALNELADVAPELNGSEKASDGDSESSSSVSGGETEKPPWSPTPPPNGLPPNSSSAQGQDSGPVADENDPTEAQNMASAIVVSHSETDAESDDDGHTSVNVSSLPVATLARSGTSERVSLEDDSDIEVSVPRALDQPQRKALSRNEVVALTSSAGQTSTAFVSSESRLQVKETPHAAEGHSGRPTKRNTYSAQSSPYGLSSRTRSKKDDGETSSSNSVIPSTFAANTDEQYDSRAIEKEDGVDKEKDRDGTDELMVIQQPQIGLTNPLQSRVEASAESKTPCAKSPVSQAHVRVFSSSPMILTSPQTPRNDAKRPVTDDMSGDSNKRVKLSRSGARFWIRSSPESIQDPRMIGRMARREFMSRFSERGEAQSSAEDIEMSDVMEDDAAGRHAPRQHTPSAMNPGGHGGASMSVRISNKEGHAYKAGATQAEEFVSPSRQPVSRKMAARLVTEQSVFQSFLAAYPEYTGDATHFINRCRKINDLHKEERMYHPSLWDDYIVRHKTDYGPYSSKCIEGGGDAVPFEKFYIEQIEQPKYMKRVMTPATLKLALEQMEPPADLLQQPARPQPLEDNSATFASPPRSSTPYVPPHRIVEKRAKATFNLALERRKYAKVWRTFQS
ncbi:hypothetical protein LTR60_003179 [Cryomyces antarcticus]|nr:hypothetical protein LTR60_003179 [Cryomyces antarcticus]